MWVGYNKGQRYSFKTKGESHAKKVVKGPKVEDPDQAKKMDSAYKMTPGWRIEQAIQEVADTNNGGFLTSKHIGPVIKWVINDIIKEEQEEFKATGFIIKDVQKHISKIVSDFLIKEIG